MKRLAKALLAGLVTWLLFTALGFWQVAGSFLSIVMAVGASFLAAIVALLVLLGGE